VWGGQEKPRSISIDGQDLPVTVNLHGALSHLRDHFFDRIIWADAVCIIRQICKSGVIKYSLWRKSMAKQIVLLCGLEIAADDSNRALEYIYLAAKQTHESFE